MQQKVLIVSARSRLVIPAISCLMEFEKVLVSSFDADLMAIFDDTLNFRQLNKYSVVIFVAISFGQLATMVQKTRKKISYDLSIAYVFDAFATKTMSAIPNYLHTFIPKIRYLRELDIIFSPIKATQESLSSEYKMNLSYLPIGVDAYHFGASGEIDKRFISINGYGRQPSVLSNLIADKCNFNNSMIYYHTDHMNISALNDPVRHRKLFWSLLKSSKIALAFDPEYYDPADRFPCSFVGQRWYESMAAGCVIVGKRPAANESLELFDWENSLIELTEEPLGAWHQIQGLLENPDLLEEISRCNSINSLKKHDWRIRIKVIAEQFSIKLSDSFKREYESILIKTD